METWSNTNCLVLRRDLKPAALCEFEATGRKANTARAGPGKISVRKFMQGKYLPPFSYTTLTPRYSWRGVFKFIESWSNTNCLVLRRDFKPTALCELEDIGRKANPARAGPF